MKELMDIAMLLLLLKVFLEIWILPFIGGALFGIGAIKREWKYVIMGPCLLLYSFFHNLEYNVYSTICFAIYVVLLIWDFSPSLKTIKGWMRR